MVIIISLNFSQGVFSPPVGSPGSDAIYKDSTILIEWAHKISVIRGLKQIDSVSLGYVSSGTNYNGQGVADGLTVSLGDSGEAIVEFEGTIFNGDGFDFAVFENAFNSTFLELAYVEVSSDGINYVRFPSQYTDTTISQIGSFGAVDATHIHNLAGKYQSLYGTPFDLSDIPDTIILDKNEITHIKIIDVIGSLSHPSYDSDGRKINDPFPTPFVSGGFDLDAVGAINFVPRLSALVDNVGSNKILIYPNPTDGILNIKSKEFVSASLIDLKGNILKKWTDKKLDIAQYSRGVYFLNINTKQGNYVRRIIKK